MSFVNLPRSDNLVMRILDEFVPVRKPSRKPGKSEQHSKVLARNAYRLINHTSVEVNVGIQLATYKIIVGQCDSLQFDRDVH